MATQPARRGGSGQRTTIPTRDEARPTCSHEACPTCSHEPDDDEADLTRHHAGAAGDRGVGVRTPLDGYIRGDRQFHDNAAAHLGL